MMNRRAPLLIFGLGIIILILLLSLFALLAEKKLSTRERSGPGQVAQKGTGPQAPGSGSQTREDPYAPPESYTERLHTVDLSKLERGAPPEIGARTKTLPKAEGGGLTVRFKIENTRRCMIGDYDIIRTEFLSKPDAKLLLTLEPVFAQDFSFQPTVKELEVGDLSRNKVHVLNVDPAKKPTHVALYICTDSNGEGLCKGKQVVDIGMGRVELDLRTGKVKKSKVKPADKVYFFQYFMLENDSLTAFKSKLNTSDYAHLVSYLNQRTGSELEVRDAVERVRRVNSTIRSATAKYRGNFIILDLPVLDPKQCRKVTYPEKYKRLMDQEK